MVRDEILALKILWVAVVLGFIIIALQWLYNTITAIPGFIYAQLTSLHLLVWVIALLLVIGIIGGYIETKYKQKKGMD